MCVEDTESINAAVNDLKNLTLHGGCREIFIKRLQKHLQKRSVAKGTF